MYSTHDIDQQVATLRQRIRHTESQLRDLKIQLHQAEANAQAAADLEIAYEGGMPLGWQDETTAILNHLMSKPANPSSNTQSQWPLSADEYKRYGRQLIMPEMGLQGQLRLKNAKVLVVGVGGLGSPAAAYLAGAGVGTIGLVDGDVVELSNLHRQVAHATSRIGNLKVDSAIEYLRGLNPTIEYVAHRKHLVPESALGIFEPYTLILDCTDHPTSRYLISDACVLLGKPLVSASALRTDGQLTVCNNPPAPQGGTNGGPCYRCLWPRPPPAESVISCGEGGILGPVVGVMGVLQALEAIKILAAGIKSPDPSSQLPPPTMLIFSAYSNPQFRTVRLRPTRRADCAACSANHSITAQSLLSGSLDYVAFCGVANPITVLTDSERVSARDFASYWNGDRTHRPTLLDVRDATQFQLCNIAGSINVPWSDFPAVIGAIRAGGDLPDWMSRGDVAVVCKLGNDSQLAARMIKDTGLARGNVVDIRDGFKAWKRDVDTSWPDY